MNRRDLLILGSTTIAWPHAAHAQQKAMPVIGFLGVGSPGPFAPHVAAFRQGLRDLGYVDGQNLFIVSRYGEGREERLRPLADELVQYGVEVIFAIGPPQAVAAAKATDKIPIVFVGGGDPVWVSQRPLHQLDAVAIGIRDPGGLGSVRATGCRLPAAS